MSTVKKTRSELKREAIVEASIEAFHQNGINETSMDKIAEMANVSKRTVYNHFASKEMLVTEIFKEIWRNLQTSMDKPYQANQPLYEQLEALLVDEMKFSSCPEYIEMIRFAMGYFIHKPDEMRDYSDEFMNADTPLKRWLTSAKEDNRLKISDVEDANHTLLDIIKGKSFWPQLLRRDPLLSEQERVDLAHKAAGMFLAYYEVK
jgi:TetR/AcrR family transcriptional regulator of autoinduction and epiphytic fitness